MPLLKDRNLKIAILISASWHFAFMVLVSPVILSASIKKNSTTISFLGSILYRVAAIPEKPLNPDKGYFMQHIENIATAGLDKVALTQPDTVSKFSDTQPDKEEIVSYEDKKKTSFFEAYPEKKYKRIIEFSNILVGGDAKNRMVLFSPDLPRAVILNSDFDFDYNVMVRFKISAHGFVESPECVISSGLPEVDYLALRYIRKWQFVPDAGESGRLIEGLAHINLAAY